MDWKYKHFERAAIFSASRERVLEAARQIVVEPPGEIQDISDGFVMQGASAWHSTIATFRFASVSSGTEISIELQVERASVGGYMLFDVGGYYNRQIDKWFSSIAQQLGSPAIPVNRVTVNEKRTQGCLIGCVVYLIAGACLTLLALPLDHALIPDLGSLPGPFTLVALGIGLLLSVGACIYVMYPDAPASKTVRDRILKRE